MTRMTKEVLSRLLLMAKRLLTRPRISHECGLLGAQVAGLALGVAILGWVALALFAPGLGAMIAVFASPLIACVVILRLLTLGPARRRRPR